MTMQLLCAFLVDNSALTGRVPPFLLLRSARS